MAVAYRSSATTNIVSKDGAAWSVTITKPSGLTAGDYMVAIIGTSSNSSVQTVSGWTTLGSQLNGADTRITVYGKTADSSDAAASDFTFAVHSGNGSTNDGMGGCLIAVSGTAPTVPSTFIDFGTANTDASTYTGGITPSVASLLIMGAWGQNSVATTVSSYAIATDNPTWTERMDDTEAVGTNDYVLGVATAPRTETTATGNFSLTFSSSADSSGVLLAVVETTNATLTPSPVALTLTAQAPSVTASASVTPSALSLQITTQAPTVASAEQKWKTTNKSNTSPTISNTDKTTP